jgi:MFS family permease
MNPTHIHLMLNHAPVLGTLFGLCLLAFGLWRKSEDNKKAALGVFVLAALLSVPVYLTGEPAEDAVKGLPGVSKSIIEAHEAAATVALVGVSLVGMSAFGGLVIFRRGKSLPVWFGSAIIGTAIIVSGMMARAANLGGQVRHTEVRAGAVLPPSTHFGDQR